MPKKTVLLEREQYLETLNLLFQQIPQAGGHTVFLLGEAGIGKTSLVNAFTHQFNFKNHVYVGTCDSLFTPRPLGPLYDIAAAFNTEFRDALKTKTDQASIFSLFLEYLSNKLHPIILVFEDIHWADEATIDLIKFLARRIAHLPCLFILTCRDHEIVEGHPLQNIFGELPKDSFTKINIQPLSLEAVRTLISDQKYTAKELYELTNGNPFFVTELLAYFPLEVPQTIHDFILALHKGKSKPLQELWALLSIMPESIEVELIYKIEPNYMRIIDECISSGFIILNNNYLQFKHELYRKSIADYLPPFKKKQMHQQVLQLLLDQVTSETNLVRIVHHAREADDKNTVAKYAPLAAQQASKLGAHLQASQLYETAIQYSEQIAPNELATLYENLAYEYYLTSRLQQAIAAQEQALAIWKAKKVPLKEGNAFRFLSRLNWFSGNRQQAETFAQAAIHVLENGFPTKERALAYSNLSQLKMLSDESEEAIYWGNKAIDLANKMNDAETLSHALNNVGTTQMSNTPDFESGEAKVQQALQLGLEFGYEEHVARAYTNLGYSYGTHKWYAKCIATLREGIAYCEERDLDSWKYYMQACLARFYVESKDWNEAEIIAKNLLVNTYHPPIVRIWAMLAQGLLLLRRGSAEALAMLEETLTLVLPTAEQQRIVLVVSAALEYEWLHNQAFPNIEPAIALANQLCSKTHNEKLHSELLYWLYKTGRTVADKDTIVDPYRLAIFGKAKEAAAQWEAMGSPYMQALALSAGSTEDQIEALLILEKLGATLPLEKLKMEMRADGVKHIPRGPRKSTKNNPAELTERQIEILRLLKNGLQNKEIAQQLFISPKTVDHHISAILSKLVVNSRSKAVAEAEKLGILGGGVK